jgi:hypothetical protein
MSLTPVAWSRSQSLYTTTPPTSVHLLPEGAEKTLCGILVPKQARPGYQRPRGLSWFEIRVYPIDVTDPSEWDLSEDEADEIPQCQRCQKATAKTTRCEGSLAYIGVSRPGQGEAYCPACSQVVPTNSLGQYRPHQRRLASSKDSC